MNIKLFWEFIRCFPALVLLVKEIREDLKEFNKEQEKKVKVKEVVNAIREIRKDIPTLDPVERRKRINHTLGDD